MGHFLYCMLIRSHDSHTDSMEEDTKRNLKECKSILYGSGCILEVGTGHITA